MDAPVAMQASSSRHMLRHATGYKLDNDGQDTRAIQPYLGHRNIQHTISNTELASDRFKNFRHDRTSCELTEFSGF
ncbi:MAG: tyrosine-type recombinase/integrase [Gloeobacterales cyanobacterium]